MFGLESWFDRYSWKRLKHVSTFTVAIVLWLFYLQGIESNRNGESKMCLPCFADVYFEEEPKKKKYKTEAMVWDPKSKSWVKIAGAPVSG